MCFQQKEPIKVQTLRLSAARMKINQIPYVIFQCTSQFSFKFCITFQCHGTMFLWNFLAELLRFGQKELIKEQIFRLLCAFSNVHPIPQANFQTTRSRFIQILNHCSVSWKITLLYFFGSIVYNLDKKQFSDFWMVGWKFTKFLMSSLKLQVSFSLNFGSLFRVMRDNSSALFYLKLYMIWTKGAHKSAKFQAFDCSRRIPPNLYFDRLLLLKVYKISAKNVQRKYLSWHWKVMKIWRKTDLRFGEWHDEFGKFWPEQVSKLELSWDPFVQS